MNANANTEDEEITFDVIGSKNSTVNKHPGTKTNAKTFKIYLTYSIRIIDLYIT